MGAVIVFLMEEVGSGRWWMAGRTDMCPKAPGQLCSLLVP